MTHFPWNLELKQSFKRKKLELELFLEILESF